MDPNETLRMIRAIIARNNGSGEPNLAEDYQELHDAVEALDGWLSKGGFAPDAWKPQPPKREPGYLGVAHRIEKVTWELTEIRQELNSLVGTTRVQGNTAADVLAAHNRGDALAEEAACVADACGAVRRTASPWRRPKGAVAKGPLQHAIRKVLYTVP